MDAPDDDADVRLQKIAGDLLVDFDASLVPFLWRRPVQARHVRARVRFRTTDRLVMLLGSFQELPQLLDRHLARWLPMLADAFLASVASTAKTPGQPAADDSGFVIPLQAAVARLLYTFCKVRGEKIVVGFFPVETRHLERLLGALDASEHSSAAGWTWEERYIVLLWLAQLLLAPFDLATISTAQPGDSDGDDDGDGLPVIAGFVWPATKLPSLVVRILPLAVKYLAAPGKERDAARTLLVRLAMRRDMQELGVRQALVAWAVAAPSASSAPSAPSASISTPYFSIGTLAFLAGLLQSAAGTSDMDDALPAILAAVRAADRLPAIRSSALARKITIKAARAIAVRCIQRPDLPDADAAVEGTIADLLDRLADSDTPVRLAASKALSLITLRLPPDMADQVIDAVLDGLQRNVLPGDLTAVDPLEWHGLMQTLAHLLYRRAPPRPALPAIAAALQRGLAFERRSVSGSATGTNVRDAACFGVWALARRYTTAEVLPLGLLQPLATALVVAACLDPAGNIRRGSSAALQELVGRHPDTVIAGIDLVQAIDYHAVARRARAATEVAQAAAALSPDYAAALRDALLGWRGLADAGDVAARRTAAASFGHIADTADTAAIQDTVGQLAARLLRLQPRQVEERHGFLLALAAVLDAALPTDSDGLPARLAASLLPVFQACQTLTSTATARRPDLLDEAASRLVVSSFPLLQTPTEGASLVDIAVACLPAWLSRAEPDVIAAASDAALVLLRAQPAASARTALVRSWADVVRQPSSGSRARQTLIASAAKKPAPTGNKTATTTGPGYVFALAKAYRAAADEEDERDVISSAILDRWAADRNIDTRVALLQALAQSPALLTGRSDFCAVLAAGLDDYTTDARGDIGSHVRLQALRAIHVLWSASSSDSTSAPASALFLRVLRLAAEKLDRVRVAAQATLAAALGEPAGSDLLALTLSSQAYFGRLLGLWDDAVAGRLGPIATAAANTGTGIKWTAALMRGFVTSADTGNEELVIASRAALVDHVLAEHAAERTRQIWLALARNLPAVPATSGTSAGTPAASTPPDRIVVPTLETVAFLFDAGVFGSSAPTTKLITASDRAALALRVRRASEKAGSVRKLEACVKVCGALAAGSSDTAAETAGDAPDIARHLLAAWLQHPWPRVRTVVVDALWALGLHQPDPAPFGALKGVDWGTAEAKAASELAGRLGLVR